MPDHNVSTKSNTKKPSPDAVSGEDKKSKKHRDSMKKQKQRVDESIAAAQIDKGVVVLLTGNGKGKTTSAFGMVMRAMGYGQKVAVIQFIKGEQLSGEEMYLRDTCPQVDFYQMATGFTWDTQDRQKDIAAAERTWKVAEAALSNEKIDLVVLDELTYMFSFKYLDENLVIDAINQRPSEQSVVLTGRGGGSSLREIADTVADVKDVKHAYTSGVQARRGVDF